MNFTRERMRRRNELLYKHHIEKEEHIVAKELNRDDIKAQTVFAELRELPVGHALNFPRLGRIKCKVVPDYNGSGDCPCANCLFNKIIRERCLSSRFCLSPFRSDRLSVYFSHQEGDAQ